MGKFDRILLDAPCSNTGVIRRRVDVRWRLKGDDFARMPAVQTGLIKNLAGLLKPGGTLVYSTCSMEPEENEEVVRRVAQEAPELMFRKSKRTLPFRDKDGRGVRGGVYAELRNRRSNSAGCFRILGRLTNACKISASLSNFLPAKFFRGDLQDEQDSEYSKGRI